MEWHLWGWKKAQGTSPHEKSSAALERIVNDFNKNVEDCKMRRIQISPFVTTPICDLKSTRQLEQTKLKKFISKRSNHLFLMRNGKQMTKISYDKMWARVLKSMQKEDAAGAITDALNF